MRRLALLMAAPVLVVAALLGTSLVAAADSQTTCADPASCKTVTVDGAGKLTSGSTSGNITFTTGLAANTTYTLVDVMETLGTDHQFVGGSYTLNFAGSCTAGSATGGTYTVNGTAPIASTYPTSPPSTTGTLPTITTDGSGDFNCNYTVSYPTIDGTNDATCGGVNLCSTRNDLFVMSGNFKVTQTASLSVPPDGAPPTSVPEAPLPILIPAGILLALGAGLVLWRRRIFASS